ncbi:hypothetical protein AAHE18_12G186400 [Arachis hypogaea]
MAEIYQELELSDVELELRWQGEHSRKQRRHDGPSATRITAFYVMEQDTMNTTADTAMVSVVVAVERRKLPRCWTAGQLEKEKDKNVCVRERSGGGKKKI